MTAPLSLPFALLRAMRPKQWVKNLLLFAGFVFTMNERWHAFTPTMWTYLSRATGAFMLFSLVSSAVYLCNDVLDVEHDRQHPTKRNRPIASGALPAWLAVLVAMLLVPVCLLGAYLLQPLFALVMAGYLVMQVGYIFV
ncbi:MAG TPA: UbiA family prenyltransferase, partial [Polyangia bacterium]